MDSAVTVIYTLKVKVDLTMPADKLIPFLEGEIDLEPCLNIEMGNLPDGFAEHDCIPDLYIEPMEVVDIFAGEHGDDAYDWDGSKLIKL